MKLAFPIVVDAGLESDPPFYVIDLLSGGSLQQFVRVEAPAARSIIRKSM